MKRETGAGDSSSDSIGAIGTRIRIVGHVVFNNEPETECCECSGENTPKVQSNYG